MSQSAAAMHEALHRVFWQRCFYLFAMLLTFVSIAPFFEHTVLINIVNALVLLAAVAAVGRSLWSFFLVLCLAVPALILRWLSLEGHESVYYDLSLRLEAVVYVTAIALLLRYVFGRAVITADRLWGAASCYLMIGLLWSFLYAIVDRHSPEAFSVRGEITPMRLSDLVYYSFSTLTTTGFGDIAPVSHAARMVSTLECIGGNLFLAILIARLASVYPPARSQS